MRQQVSDLQFADCERQDPCWQEKVATLTDLVRRHPGEVFVERAYQDARRVIRSEADALREEYEARLAENPKDPSLHYLLSRLLAQDQEAAKQHLKEALRLDPSHPWANFALMVFSFQDSPGDAIQERRFRTFVEGCPEELFTTVVYAGRFSDREFWQPYLDKVERELPEAPWSVQTQTYPLLWSAWFRLAEPTDFSALRGRIARQLAKIEALERRDDRRWWRLLEKGYELSGDQEKLANVQRQLLDADPCSFESTSKKVEGFLTGLGLDVRTGFSVDELSTDARRAFLEQTGAWREECPRAVTYVMMRFTALRAAEDLDPVALRSEIDRLLAAWAQLQDSMSTARSPYFLAAQLLLDRSIDVERVPELVERERALRLRRRRELPADMPAQMRRRIEASYDQEDFEHAELTGRALLALGRLDEAKKPVSQMRDSLAALRERGVGEPEVPLQPYAARLSLMDAELALAAGRTDEAAEALRAATTVGLPPSYERRLEAVAERLDLDLEAVRRAARSEVAGEVRTATEPSRWLPEQRPVPEFELTDLAGKTWQEKDLLAGATLINVWATWCGPCLYELPEVQKLHERLARREELRVVTLNIDENPGLVQPFVEREGLTFPVLLATDAIHAWWNDYISIPRTWIVDRHGVIQLEQIGFDPSKGDTWAEEALEQLEAVAKRP